MTKFKKYKRTQIAELRPVTDREVRLFHNVYPLLTNEIGVKISISEEDLRNGSPKPGDMIARNPDNYNDQWLVAKEYFDKNFDTH